MTGLQDALRQQLSLNLRSFWRSQARSAPATIHLVRQYLGYSSPLACQLANRRAFSLAQQLATCLQPHRSVRAKDTGWLEFELHAAEWRAWLVAGWSAAPGSIVPTLPVPSDIGLHQYAHARCCAWLDLGHRTGLLSPTASPETIAWERLPVAPPLHQASLLGALMDLGDRAANPEVLSRFGEPEALHLAAAVLEFQQNCPLWGENQRRDRELARARLGLVGVARNVLSDLIARLGLPAPQEL